jgi:hypothetical protein
MDNAINQAIQGFLEWCVARFGATKMDRTFNGVAAPRVVAAWAAELHGFTEAELRRGMEGCRRLEWPPTLPEFIGLCRPPIHPELAHAEAQVQMRARDRGDPEDWSNPAIFYAAADMGRDLFQFSYAQSKARWIHALKRAEDGIAAGRLPATIPPRQLALPAPRMEATPVEVARERCASLRSRMPNLFKPRETDLQEGGA